MTPMALHCFGAALLVEVVQGELGRRHRMHLGQGRHDAESGLVGMDDL